MIVTKKRHEALRSELQGQVDALLQDAILEVESR